MQIGDLDGDGHDDLAFTFASSLASGDGAYAAALYDPGLTLANQPALHFGFQPSNDSSADLHTLTGGAGALQIGDVAAPANPSADTDGHPDLVIAQPQSGQIVVLANDPSSPGTSFAPYGTPTRFGDGTAVTNGPDGLTLGRIDADGRLDMVAWATRPAAADWEVYTATRPPAVVLSTSATKAFAGAPVTFTATATAPAGSPEDATLDHVDWDFDGDGTVDQTTTTPTVDHAFTTTGIYQVVLRVTDGDGVVATVTRPVGVAAVLTADLRIVPAQPAPGQAVSFDATTTVGGTRPYTYAWTLDGSLLGGPGDGADQIQRTFATPGHHTIALGDRRSRPLERRRGPVVQGRRACGRRVRDEAGPAGDGRAGQLRRRPVDRRDHPAALRVGPRRGRQLRGRHGAAAADQVTFTADGVHTVGLRVTDADGVSTTTTHNVAVAPALTASLTHSPAIPAPGQVVTLNAGASTGGAGALTFGFDLDGAGTFAGSAGGAPAFATTFATLGDHAVAVRATDSGGHQQVAGDVVTVADPLVAALTVTPAHPETGDTVTLDASGSGGVGSLHYGFDLDGDGRVDGAASTAPTATSTVLAPGTARFGVAVGDDRSQQAQAIATTLVTPRLVPAFSVPAVITDDQPASFDASATAGGAPPLHLRWDLDGNGSYETDGGSAVTETASLTHDGTQTVGLEVTDALGHVHTVRRTVTVLQGCIHVLHVGVTLVTTANDTVCLNRTSGSADASYAASGDIAVNGMPIVKAPNSTLTITPAIGSALARITGTAVRVDEGGANLVNGAINWLLPAGAPGQEHSIGGVGFPPDGIDLLGLHVEGRVEFALGTDTNGTPYVRIGAYLEIPGFKLTEAAESPGVTGKISLRIDANGVHFDAVKIEVDHAKLHDLDVNDICLSYVAAGQTGDQCDQFEDPAGQPFLTCATDNTTNRWNGTMDVTLPTKGDAGFAFSGELQNGTLGNVAAKAEFGHTVPLEEGVYLKSIAAGVCLTPAPLQIRGQAVISALPLGSEEAVEVDGSFHYVDAANGQPLSITLQGGLTMFDHHIADGTLSLDGDDALDVGFDAHVQLPSDDVDAASVDGIRALRLHRTARHTILAWDGSRLASRYEVSATSTEGYQRLYVSPATCRVVSLPASPSSTSVSVTITPIGANGRRGGAAGLRLPVRRVRAGAKAAHPVAGVPRSRCG